MFQEGRDPMAERAFREIARLTRGAYCRFDARRRRGAPRAVRAAAAYAAGGMRALADLSRGAQKAPLRLLAQMRP